MTTINAYNAFDGKTYEPELDFTRLHSQLARVLDLMIDGEWRTLDQIHSSIGGSIPSISARLRDLRKSKFGEFNVERRRVGVGLFEYRVTR